MISNGNVTLLNLWGLRMLVIKPQYELKPLLSLLELAQFLINVFSGLIWMKSLTWDTYHSCQTSVAVVFPEVIVGLT